MLKTVAIVPETKPIYSVHEVKPDTRSIPGGLTVVKVEEETFKRWKRAVSAYEKVQQEMYAVGV